MYAITTLSEIRAAGWKLYANCNGRDCGRGSELPVDALIREFGGDHCLINDTRIASRLRCLRCGHRGGAIHVVPPAAVKS